MAPTSQLAGLGWSRGFVAPRHGLGSQGSDPLSAAAAAAAATAVNRTADAIASLFKPDTDKQQTSALVNEIETDVMKPNVANWKSIPDALKTRALQQQFEGVFHNGWNHVLTFCFNPKLGSAGAACVDDRRRDGKWDWWSYYYDPIANDPAVAANVTTPDYSPAGDETGASQSATGGGSTSAPSPDNTKLYLGLGLVAAGLLLFIESPS